MISINNFLRRNTLYILCIFLFIAITVQIDGHIPNSCCPLDQSIGSGNNYCYVCDTAHYGTVDGYNHDIELPKFDITIFTSACAGPVDAEASTSLGAENLAYFDDEVHSRMYNGSAKGYAGNGSTVGGKPPYFIWIKIKDAEDTIGGGLNIPWLSGEKSRTTPTKTTKTQELNLSDFRLPTSRNSAQIRGNIETPHGFSISDSTRGEYEGSTSDAIMGTLSYPTMAYNFSISCNNATYQD